MFESCHSPEEVAYVYTHRHGLPATVVDRRVCYLTTSNLGAVVMPPELGRRVWTAIDQSYPTLIIHHVQPDRVSRPWVFVVGPNCGLARSRAVAALKQRGGSVVGAGRYRRWRTTARKHAAAQWNCGRTTDTEAEAQGALRDAQAVAGFALRVPTTKTAG